MKNARIELHLHLDGSLDLPWAYKKSIERDVIPRETTFEEYYNMIHAPTIHHTEEGFKKFDLLRRNADSRGFGRIHIQPYKTA